MWCFQCLSVILLRSVSCVFYNKDWIGLDWQRGWHADMPRPRLLVVPTRTYPPCSNSALSAFVRESVCCLRCCEPCSHPVCCGVRGRRHTISCKEISLRCDSSSRLRWREPLFSTLCSHLGTRGGKFLTAPCWPLLEPPPD